MSHRIVVIGAGLIGSHIARLLAAEPDISATAVDLDEGALAHLNGIDRLTPRKADVLGGDMASVADGADAIVSAVPSAIGTRVVRAAIQTGTPVVDISFSPEDPLELDSLAAEHGVPVIPDCGIAPGMTNFCAGRAAAELTTIDDISMFVGGLPAERRTPFEYTTVYAPADVLEEYTRPCFQIENGEVVERAALSDLEQHEFAGVGTLESFNTDGLRTMLKTIKAQRMREKTLRYPGHCALMQTFGHAGLFDRKPRSVRADGGTATVRPIDMTLELLKEAWRPRESDRDMLLLRVDVTGQGKNGQPHGVRYEIVDHYRDGATAMARCTGTPCALMALALARGELSALAAGVQPPERIGHEPAYFDALVEGLARHHITVVQSAITPPA